MKESFNCWASAERRSFSAEADVLTFPRSEYLPANTQLQSRALNLPAAIIPGYPIMVKSIPLTGAGGHRLALRFEPHDIGKADFHPQPLAIEDGVLVMPRRELELLLHFKRQP
jgi:hypothetical protein